MERQSCADTSLTVKVLSAATQQEVMSLLLTSFTLEDDKVAYLLDHGFNLRKTFYDVVTVYLL